MAKKLNLTTIKKGNSRYNNKLKIELPNDTYLTITPFFKPQKISLMVEDLAFVITDAEELGVNFDDHHFIDLLNFFIIKHFTDINLPNDTKKLIQGFIEIVNSEYYEPIMNAFPHDEIVQVYDKVLKSTEIAAQLENKIRDFQKQVERIKDEKLKGGNNVKRV
jgi:hypothetical protein